MITEKSITIIPTNIKNNYAIHAKYQRFYFIRFIEFHRNAPVYPNHVLHVTRHTAPRT